MKGIKEFLGVSLIDWPKRIAAVIFVGGCNFRCPFCYNADLVLNSQKIPDLDEKKILEKLKERKDFIEGVVFTGGEPTLNPDLETSIRKIKEVGLKTALETNGSNPEILAKLIKQNLLDGIFMDIKGPINKYNELTGVPVDINKIRKSAEIIKNNYPKIEAEFRTTVAPELITKESIKEIGQWLGPNCKVPYFLQQFRPKKTLNPRLQQKKPYSKKILEEMLKIAQKYFKQAALRGI
jgi:pyruvate formate lyase activating enzyme